MQNFPMLLRSLFLIIAVFIAIVPLFGQQDESTGAPQAVQDQARSSDNLVNPDSTAKPAFSAEKYIRVERKMPGSKPVILSESRPMKIARSAEGLVRVQGEASTMNAQNRKDQLRPLVRLKM